MTDLLLILLCVFALAGLAVQCVLLAKQRWSGVSAQTVPLQRALEQHHREACDRMERELRGELQNSAQGTRQEMNANLAQFQQTMAAQLTSVATVQNGQIDVFSQQLAKLAEANSQQLEAMRQAIGQQAQAGREEMAAGMKRFGDTLHQTLATLTESNSQRMAEVRATLEAKIRELQTDNGARLEEMRKTVDEKLHATLELRLGESFKQVSERLEKVHQGLGEMQQLAVGVGDLKRMMSNVKSRGTWGEVQLGNLLEQILTPEQYETNVATRPGSRERVEFAIKFPGQGDTTVWLPIDCKFPLEDFQRLQEAQETADLAAVEAAGKALEARVRLEARSIKEKYIDPPHTLDFALLYLPIEGLYAEILRRPGLSDAIQRECRVTLCGPTTLTAMLNSLQMGFRTLAIEKRSSEVWQTLGKVKAEFGKFGDVLAKTKKKLEEATNTIGDAETRTRVIERSLRDVAALPEAEGLVALQKDDLPKDDLPKDALQKEDLQREASVVELLPRSTDLGG